MGIVGQIAVDLGWDGTLDHVNAGSIILSIMFGCFFVYWFLIRNAHKVIQ